MKFKGKVWHKEKGELTDKFLYWVIQKRQSQKLWGKQVIVEIKEEDSP